MVDSNNSHADGSSGVYDIDEMKHFFKSLRLSKKKQRRKIEICTMGIEMYLLSREDILHILDQTVSDEEASSFLHHKVMSM